MKFCTNRIYLENYLNHEIHIFVMSIDTFSESPGGAEGNLGRDCCEDKPSEAKPKVPSVGLDAYKEYGGGASGYKLDWDVEIDGAVAIVDGIGIDEDILASAILGGIGLAAYGSG